MGLRPLRMIPKIQSTCCWQYANQFHSTNIHKTHYVSATVLGDTEVSKKELAVQSD